MRALAFAALSSICVAAELPPYPPSPVIERVDFDFSTHLRQAPGSDNWPTTWADDGHIYTAWGDGGGFGGTNSEGRVSLGVARVEGDPHGYIGRNVWGGFESPNPAQFPGKAYGILSVAANLYMWVAHQPNPHLARCQLAHSADHGASWEFAAWSFTYEDQLTVPTFLNFGRGNTGARDDYIYAYFIEPSWGPDKANATAHGFDVHRPGRIHLARVPQAVILRRNAYEFYAGPGETGTPNWSSEVRRKKSVFEDRNGVGWNVSVCYNAGLGRYLLATEHGASHAGRFGLFDAPEPWGPWSTIAYDESWGAEHVEPTTFYWNFPTKWFSPDGANFTMVFTGNKSNDSWNTVNGQFIQRRRAGEAKAK